MKRLPDQITPQEKYNPAMAITEQAEADEYFEACVQHNMRFGTSREDAEQIERFNLGYYAGYFDRKIQLRIYKLFNCSHPILGVEQPSPEEALRLGMSIGEKPKGKSDRT